MGRSYDDDSFSVVHQLPVIGKTIAGTQAASAEVFVWKVSSNLTAGKVPAVAYNITTGGTAAGPAVTIERSLAGTGAAEVFGTLTFGTVANSTAGNMSITSTNFLAGDEVRIKTVVGTAASSPIVDFFIGWQERYV